MPFSQAGLARRRVQARSRLGWAVLGALLLLVVLHRIAWPLALSGGCALVALAVLRDHEQFVGMAPTPRSLRLARCLKRLHLSWLLIPWDLVVAAQFFLPAFRGGFPDGEQETVRLYRRLSGKDPQVARAEVSRIGMQLGMLDQRLRELDEQRPGTPRGADPGELEVAAGALVGFYLASRRTDDEVLAKIEAAWAEYEELTQQQLERAVGRRRLGRGRGEPAVDERVQAAADRYRAAWRHWLDRQAEGAGSPRGIDRPAPVKIS